MTGKRTTIDSRPRSVQADQIVLVTPWGHGARWWSQSITNAAGTRYVNGSLFAKAAKVHLDPRELAVLVEAAHSGWGKVNPAIFGSLMEGCLGQDRRWELGAHYTHEADIMKIIRPTIMQPWHNRIYMTKTVADVKRACLKSCVRSASLILPAAAATFFTLRTANCDVWNTS